SRHLKSDPPDSPDIFLPRVCCRYLLSDIAHMDIHCVVLAVVSVLPDLLIQIFTGENLVRTAHQDPQDLELMGRQCKRMPIDRRLPSTSAERKILILQFLLCA